jgi:hypothetical protein
MKAKWVRQVGIAVLAFVCAAAASSAEAKRTASPTIALSAGTVEYGMPLTISGTVPGAGAGQKIDILSQPCGFTLPTPVATVKTTLGGKYVFKVEPTLNTTFSAKSAVATSARAIVHITPLVQLRRLGLQAFVADVSVGGGQFFAKAPVALERYDAKTKVWHTVRTALLKQASEVGAIRAVSSASIRANLAKGTVVRASVPQSTVGPCYRPGASQPLTL